MIGEAIYIFVRGRERSSRRVPAGVNEGMNIKVSRQRILSPRRESQASIMSLTNLFKFLVLGPEVPA